MNILLINGSPKGKRSNTYRLASAFLEGMKGTGASEAFGEHKIQVEELQVNRLDIKPCLGCFSCWNKTPGQCCIKDDMQRVLEKMLWADEIIWSFPLYYFSVPGSLKNLIDRQLPMVLPFMEADTESGGHPSRYDMSKKRHVVISTCGFYTAKGNYDGVTAMFDHLCGKGNYTTVFCGQGELFRVPELAKQTDEYLSYVKTAGQEYVTAGISEETKARLGQLLFPREIFEKMADASWGVDRESGQKEDESLIFTRQMAALYRKENYPGKDMVLEMYYTDLDKRYQILLGAEGSKTLTENFTEFTTKIETPYTVWKDIASGKISGEEAMMQQLYRVKGDFNLMLRWDDYFGGTSGAGSGGGGEKGQTAAGQSGGQGGIHMPIKETTMNQLLVPWITFWVAVAIDGFAGSLVSIGVCALTGLIFYRNKKTIYDVITQVCVALFSILVLLGVSTRLVVPLAYLGFGLMWALSCFTAIPLTAHYSMNDYNGEAALKNPLFMKTNRILTLAWGILYLLTPIWTYVLMGTKIASLTGAVNSILPALMGMFTNWFQKWYPAWVARGGKRR